MDKEALKKYLLFLSLIKERELASPSGEVISNDPSTWWLTSNFDHGLAEQEFVDFFQNMDALKIIQMMNMHNLSEYLSSEGVTDSDEDEIVIQYTGINMRKLDAFEQILTSLLTPEEVTSLRLTGTFLGEVVKEAGGLKMHTGGLISYNNSHVHLRTGLRDLCEVFIDRPGQLLDRSTLEDEIGIRTRDSKGTVAKYVSALNIVLETHYGRKPISSYKKEGWRFIPE